MTTEELAKGLQVLINTYGGMCTVADVTLKSARHFLVTSGYSIEEARIIVGAYYGFCTGFRSGRKYGFQQGVNYIFEHEPTPEELGEPVFVVK